MTNSIKFSDQPDGFYLEAEMAAPAFRGRRKFANMADAASWLSCRLAEGESGPRWQRNIKGVFLGRFDYGSAGVAHVTACDYWWVRGVVVYVISDTSIRCRSSEGVCGVNGAGVTAWTVARELGLPITADGSSIVGDAEVKAELKSLKAMIRLADLVAIDKSSGAVKYGSYGKDGNYKPPVSLPNIPTLERDYQFAQSRVTRLQDDLMAMQARVERMALAFQQFGLMGCAERHG